MGNVNCASSNRNIQNDPFLECVSDVDNSLDHFKKSLDTVYEAIKYNDSYPFESHDKQKHTTPSDPQSRNCLAHFENLLTKEEEVRKYLLHIKSIVEKRNQPSEEHNINSPELSAETRPESDVWPSSGDKKLDLKYQRGRLKAENRLPTTSVQITQTKPNKDIRSREKSVNPLETESESKYNSYIPSRKQKHEQDEAARYEKRIRSEYQGKEKKTLQKENEDISQEMITSNVENLKQQQRETHLDNVLSKHPEIEKMFECLKREKDALKKENEAIQQKLDKRYVEMSKLKEDLENCLSSKKKYEVEVDKLEKENESLRNKKNKDIQRVMNGHDEVTKTRECFDSHLADKEGTNSFNIEIETLKLENGVLQNQITSIRSEHTQLLESLENEKIELKKEQETIQRKRLEQDAKQFTHMDDLQNQLKKAIDANEKYMLQISDLLPYKEADENRRTRTEQIEEKVQKLDAENKHLKENNVRTTEREKCAKEKFEQTVEDLNKKQNLLEIENKSFLQKNQDLQTKLEIQKECNDATLNELKDDLDQLRERNSETEKVAENLRFENETLQQNFDSLQKELDTLKNSKVLRIQLYRPQRAAFVSEVESELKVLLKKEMNNEMTVLEFTECDGACYVDPNIPVLIVCVSASRLGTDARNAIQTLKVTSKMALVIFHHKDTHALPTQASGRVLTGQVFEHLGGIYDIAFLSMKGIYHCKMNEENIKGIVHFLKKEGVRCFGEAT